MCAQIECTSFFYRIALSMRALVRAADTRMGVRVIFPILADNRTREGNFGAIVLNRLYSYDAILRPRDLKVETIVTECASTDPLPETRKRQAANSTRAVFA